MKVKVSNISERDLRLYMEGYLDSFEDFKEVLNVIDEMYQGRMVQLLYRLITGESGMFRLYDDSILASQEHDPEKATKFAPLKEFLDNDNDTEKVCVVVTKETAGNLIDLTYISEFSKLLEYCRDDKQAMSTYWLIVKLFDIFIGQMLNVICEEDEQEESNDGEKIDFLYVKNKFDNLELVLF